MFIVMECSKNKRLGVFRTHRQAKRFASHVKARVPQAKVKIEQEWYYSTRAFCYTLERWLDRRAQKRYRKLCFKRDKLNYQIAKYK